MTTEKLRSRIVVIIGALLILSGASIGYYGYQNQQYYTEVFDDIVTGPEQGPAQLSGMVNPYWWHMVGLIVIGAILIRMEFRRKLGYSGGREEPSKKSVI